MWLGYSVEFWISCAIAAFGILLTIRYGTRKAKGRLTIGIAQSASLMSEVARDIPNIRIVYRGQEVQDELIWISCVLVNTGQLDIGRSIVAKYPHLRLPDGAVWEEVSIIDGANSSTTEARIVTHGSSEIELAWALMKPFESISFSALIRTTDHQLVADLRNGQGVSISARIENTNCANEPEFARVPSITSLRGPIIRAAMYGAFLISLPIMMFVPYFQRTDWVTAYQFSGQSSWYTPESQHDDVLKFYAVEDQSKTLQIPAADFKPVASRFTEIPDHHKREGVIWIVLGSVLLLLSTVLYVLDIRRDYRRCRYLNPACSFYDIFRRRAESAPRAAHSI